MSVINQMLKDLEQRQQQVEQSTTRPLTPVTVNKQGLPFSPWWLLLPVTFASSYVAAIYAPSLLGEPVAVNMVSPAPSETSMPLLVQTVAAQTLESQPLETQLPIETEQVLEEPAIYTHTVELPELDPESEPEPALATVSVPVPVSTPVTVATAVAAPASQLESKPEPEAEPMPVAVQIAEVKLTPKEQANNHYLQGLLAEQQQHWQSAQDAYQQALQLDPSRDDARLAQANLLFQVFADPKQALVLVLEVEDHQRLLAQQKYQLQGSIAEHLQQYHLAEQAYSQLITLLPEQGRWLFAKGYVLDIQAQYQQAIPYYQQAQSKAELSPELRLYIAQRLKQLGVRG